MEPIQLTKDADKFLCQVYQSYLEKKESGIDKRNAKSFPIAAILKEELSLPYSVEDIGCFVSELSSVSFVKQYMYYSFSLQDKAISYMEHRFTNGLKDVIDFLSKLSRIIP